MIRRITYLFRELGEMVANQAEAQAEIWDSLSQPPPGVPTIDDLTIHSVTIKENDVTADITVDLHSLIRQCIALSEDIYDILMDLQSSLSKEDMEELVAWVRENQAEFQVAYINIKDGEIDVQHVKADPM